MPERVLVAPPDLRLADPQVAHEIYHGRFPLAGHMVECGGQSPFQIEAPPEAWLEALHGFRWLRHMHAADTELAAANARSLVDEWIASHGRRIAGPAWRPHIAARRIIAWLQHSGVVLHNAEFQFQRQFLKSLALQVRYLRTMAPEMPDGEARLRARAALAFAALALPAPVSALRTASRNLSAELESQIHPDGGHISRDPLAVLELLADLLPLRQTYANQAEAPPDALLGAVERMLPALRFFRHRDGSLARFNGMGITVHDRVAAILRHDDTAGAPLLHAPHSGYQRLILGETTVLADTGPPPPSDVSDHAHAGCLSFELSSGRHQFVVNCGVDTYGADDFRPLSRATAAHSTVTLNDASQARFTLSPGIARMIGTPLLAGPTKVECTREDGPGVHRFVAAHDGYVARFGIHHERALALSADGTVLDGVDRFFSSRSATPTDNGRDQVAIRFHIHPDIELFHDGNGRLVMAGTATDRWTFACETVEPTVEESIFFAGLSGPCRSRQIVLHFKASAVAEVRWRLSCARRDLGIG